MQISVGQADWPLIHYPCEGTEFATVERKEDKGNNELSYIRRTAHRRGPFWTSLFQVESENESVHFRHTEPDPCYQSRENSRAAQKSARSEERRVGKECR